MFEIEMRSPHLRIKRIMQSFAAVRRQTLRGTANNWSGKVVRQAL